MYYFIKLSILYQNIIDFTNEKQDMFNRNVTFLYFE